MTTKAVSRRSDLLTFLRFLNASAECVKFRNGPGVTPAVGPECVQLWSRTKHTADRSETVELSNHAPDCASTFSAAVPICVPRRERKWRFRAKFATFGAAISVTSLKRTLSRSGSANSVSRRSVESKRRLHHTQIAIEIHLCRLHMKGLGRWSLAIPEPGAVILNCKYD